MTLKEQYAEFVKQWILTHSVSKPPSYSSWKLYYR